MRHVSGKRMCKILESRGWILDRINGSHHIFEHPDFPNSANVPVHGNQDLPTGTQRNIMRTAGLTDGDLA